MAESLTKTGLAVLFISDGSDANAVRFTGKELRLIGILLA
jgi:hypothetical protein